MLDNDIAVIFTKDDLGIIGTKRVFGGKAPDKTLVLCVLLTRGRYGLGRVIDFEKRLEEFLSVLPDRFFILFLRPLGFFVF